MILSASSGATRPGLFVFCPCSHHCCSSVSTAFSSPPTFWDCDRAALTNRTKPSKHHINFFFIERLRRYFEILKENCRGVRVIRYLAAEDVKLTKILRAPSDTRWLLAGVRNFLCLEFFSLAKNAVGFLGFWIGPQASAPVSSVERLRMPANAHFVALHVTLAPSVMRTRVWSNRVYHLNNFRLQLCYY